MTRPTPGAVTSTTSYGADGWWERAACRNADPDAFTPPPDEYRPMTPAEADYAHTYCARCPVTAECLKDALDKGDDYGIPRRHRHGDKEQAPPRQDSRQGQAPHRE